MKVNDTLKDKDISERDPLFEETMEIFKNFSESNNLKTRRSLEVFKKIYKEHSALDIIEPIKLFFNYVRQVI